MIKIIYSINGQDYKEVASEETEFVFDREHREIEIVKGFKSDEINPFSDDFPEKVSLEDQNIFDAIVKLMDSQKKACCKETNIRIYVSVSAITKNGQWYKTVEPSEWYVDIKGGDGLENIASGWRPSSSVKISYSIHGEDDISLCSEESEFYFYCGPTSPFSSNFPEQVSAQDRKVLDTIRKFVSQSRPENFPDVFRVYAWVSAEGIAPDQIGGVTNWSEIAEPSKWMVETDLRKIGKCESSGWQLY